MGKGKRSKKESVQGKSHRFRRKKSKEEVIYKYYTDFDDEVKLPPHLKKVFDYATNMANAASMYESHLVKAPKKKTKELLNSRYIKIRVKKNKIKKVKPVKEEEINS